ncbi:zinc protease [Kitasatospora sp. MAA4]|uniref:M16 family metallopeptidase n=1 Tax=Kitasatospora sp. MAA4 TaxID=3035093 RepID=UPI002475CFEA|nr:pitrilysin family protein [Kitasatospora sp. MAA4]MDH6131091.1 zinc protease [Kitasatospora sp. MAA4]
MALLAHSASSGPTRRVERATLGNGLRLVLSPDRHALVAAVAVVYGVGTRTEPEGRSGFAHLFEHLMFQGSVSLRKAAYTRHVERSGGTFRGSTHLDFTLYGEVAPANALHRMLYLESDRMHGLRLTEANLANQVSVVEEEIRATVLSRPYGGLPWPRLPSLMFETFPNTHDGRGSFADLERATLAEAAGFFDRYYAAGNAVLCVCGDFEPDRALRAIERCFGDIPPRPAPAPADLGEPERAGERRACYRDPVAPLPALAWGWRVPDPIGDLAGFLPYLLVAGLLAGTDGSRLVRRLVFEDRTATSVTGRVGFLADPFTVRDPSALVFQARLPAGADAWRILDAVGEEIERLAAVGPEPAELDGVAARLIVEQLDRTDSVLGRAERLAVFELQRGDPFLLGELPRLLGSVSAGDVREAAARLTPDRRSGIEVVPRAERR